MKYAQCALPSITAAQLYRIACIKLMRNTLETLWVSIGSLYILTYCKSRKTTLLTYFLVISYGYTLLTCSKKYRLLMSRYFCVQSSSDSRSASRPITVITPRTTLVTSMKSPSSLSTHTAARRSSRERVPGRTAFPRFLPRNSHSPRVLAPRLR